ncbi:MAG: hypothetical protein JWN67_1045 [Actinomycetia bacterium]|nr:hypothetical protein [Actinomycetes bacterium]
MGRKVVVGLVAALALVAVAPATSHAAGDERWALLVGVNDYAGRTHDTVGAVGDATDLRDVLLRAGWRSDHIRVLLDRRASAAAIRDGLSWLASHASPRSFTVFHYSGHVKQIGGDRDHDGEATDEYLWGADNRFIADGELAQRVRPMAGRVWVDIAGCEAAGFDDGISSRNHLFTASSRENEKSYEQPKWRNSVFSGFLVDQALLHGAAGTSRDGRTSIQRAFAHAASNAPKMTARQSRGPQHPVLRGGDGNEWYLGSPPPPPPPPARQPPQSAPRPSPSNCALLCIS